MRWMRWIRCLTVIATGLICSPAIADSWNVKCNFVAADQASLPNDVRVLMKSRGDIEAKICTAPKHAKTDSNEMSTDAQNSYMTLASSGCPRYESSRYIHIVELSEGVFEGIDSYWSSISSSETTLSQALHASLQKTGRAQLYNQLLQNYRINNLRLVSIELRDALGRNRESGYVLLIADNRKPSGWWQLLIDLAPTGFRVFDLSFVEY